MVNGLRWAKDKGINEVGKYAKYDAKKALRCGNSTGSFKVKSYVTVGTCSDLAHAITQHPVSVAVESNDYMKNYKKGIFSDCS